MFAVLKNPESLSCPDARAVPAVPGPDAHPRHTDFTAKLVDVYPPNADYPAGVDLNVGDSIVRARYRESLKASQPLGSGKPYEFTIEMYPTSLVFRRGTGSAPMSPAAISRAST